ncbi:MAG: ATP-binding cassette domain-containing protein [Gammaproteobacteria bacterium]|nr:ATP-binding cassette domain-containing protein [Gammaproteobacteria bacterium]
MAYVQSAVPSRSIFPLDLRNVCYSKAGQSLITDITVTLQARGRTIVMGPNGAGKSLLMRLCHGLIRPSAGQVNWSSEQRHAQAMVFQTPVLLRRSAIKNVEFALRATGARARDRRELAEAALQQAGIAHLAHRQARVLSGGEKQKLALARAWSIRPQILFLDEPTAHLDPSAVYAIEQMIKSIDEQGTKIVMSTHDLSQAQRLADEVLFLHQGKLVEHAAALVFFEQPHTPAAQAFVNGELYWE